MKSKTKIKKNKECNRALHFDPSTAIAKELILHPATASNKQNPARHVNQNAEQERVTKNRERIDTGEEVIEVDSFVIGEMKS